MKFVVPWAEQITFEIPACWWKKAEMEDFFPTGGHYLPRTKKNMKIVPISSIEPFLREVGFKKKRMINILTGFKRNSRIDPIKVGFTVKNERYKYAIYNGYHRFYASIGAGYSRISVIEGAWT